MTRIMLVLDLKASKKYTPFQLLAWYASNRKDALRICLVCAICDEQASNNLKCRGWDWSWAATRVNSSKSSKRLLRHCCRVTIMMDACYHSSLNRVYLGSSTSVSTGICVSKTCYELLLLRLPSIIHGGNICPPPPNPPNCRNSNTTFPDSVQFVFQIACETGNSSTEPLLEDQFAQIHVNLRWSVFGRNRTRNLQITRFFKCCALHHWAYMTDE